MSGVFPVLRKNFLAWRKKQPIYLGKSTDSNYFPIPVIFPVLTASNHGRRSFRKLLRRKVENRLGSERGASAVREHRFFENIDWERVIEKSYEPPHVPVLSRAEGDVDTSQFDPRFTSKSPRESECPGVTDVCRDLNFADFDYVSPDCPGGSGALVKPVAGPASTIAEMTEVVLDLDPVDDNMPINMHDLHIRQRGE